MHHVKRAQAKVYISSSPAEDVHVEWVNIPNSRDAPQKEVELRDYALKGESNG
jgi:hypothetical protein